MIREDRFLISNRPYAIDLSSFRSTTNNYPGGRRSYNCQVDAVWFRRRKGITVACIGTLGDIQEGLPADAIEFLERHCDGRYGGDCHGRWDGDRYWGSQHPDEIDSHLALLKPMLANFPQVPPGYDGWWRF